jgi:hypothetical protein
MIKLTGIRTSELRKIYSAVMPLASAGASAKNEKKAKAKTEILALDGVSL